MTKKQPDFDFLKEEMDSSGFEGINAETMSIPFIRLLQDLSPQLKKNKPEYIEGAKAGEFFNTITGEVYGETLRIVVGKFERYYIEWKPNRQGFVATHDVGYVDGNPKLFERNERNQLEHIKTGNIFQETYIYYVLLPDHLSDGVCVISMASTQLKEARRLNRMLTTTMIPGTEQRALPYFMIWNVKVVPMSNDQGDWYGWQFDLDSMVTQDVLECVKEERKALPSKQVDFKQLEILESNDEDVPF